jgi:hypothetical protein
MGVHLLFEVQHLMAVTVVTQDGCEARAPLTLNHGGTWKPPWKGRVHELVPVVLVDACPSPCVGWLDE